MSTGCCVVVVGIVVVVGGVGEDGKASESIFGSDAKGVQDSDFEKPEKSIGWAQPCQSVKDPEQDSIQKDRECESCEPGSVSSAAVSLGGSVTAEE